MKILVIEDDEFKANQIKKFLKDCYKVDNDNIIIRKAFQSGMESIINDNFDIILLDMSIPSFDIAINKSAGRYRYLGGKDVLNEMLRKSINIPTIVVTQFSIFGEGDKQIDEKQLDNLLSRNYNNIYIGMVHYNASVLDWKDKLAEFINSITRN